MSLSVKAVVYDLDDTLYSFHSLNKAAQDHMAKTASRNLSVSKEDFVQVFESSYEKLNDRLHEVISIHESDDMSLRSDIALCHSRSARLTYTLEKLGCAPLPHVLTLYNAYWGYILDHITPEPQIAETLQALKERGIRIGLGTNMTARMQYEKIVRLGLAPFFDFVLTSGETLWDKPHPAFFERLRFKALCAPGQILFVGDNPFHDYLGASTAGMQALWYNPYGRALPAGAPPIPEERVIRKHPEVLNYL